MIWNRHWRPCLSKHLCHQATSKNLNPYFAHLLPSYKGYQEMLFFVCPYHVCLLLFQLNREHSNLKASLLQLGLTAQQIVLQWLPGHCNIWGNTRADQLAKEGSQLEQLDGGSSYAESKTLVKAAMARKWKSDHPDSDPSDPIHGMTRSQQTTIFRLRTGHNRLRQHMYKRFKVGDSEICPCGQAPQNTEHVLQTCSSHKQLRARTWPNHTPLEKKLYGTTEELALTVDYIVASGLTV